MTIKISHIVAIDNKSHLYKRCSSLFNLVIVQGNDKDMVAISRSQVTLVSAVYLRNRSIIGFMTS